MKIAPDTENLVQRLAASLASRPSRRGFIGFAGKAALAGGMWLSGGSLAEAAHCAVCRGGPCPECSSPHGQCVGCIDGAGCPSNCTQSSWHCCNNLCGGNSQICAECTCPGDTCCYCFVCSSVVC